jgi:hypothetical protein
VKPLRRGAKPAASSGAGARNSKAPRGTQPASSRGWKEAAMVERAKREELVGACMDCGEDVGLEDSHAFEWGGGGALCWTCALKRGGVYDEKYDRWVVAPKVEDLPDERRPHA